MIDTISIPAIVGIGLALVAIYKYLIFPLFISPLSKIPNAHPTSAISSVWILWMRYTNRINSAVHAAHQKHGPVVLLAPDEISVNCVDGGIRTVYGGFEKTEMYFRIFGNYGLGQPILDKFDADAHRVSGFPTCSPLSTASLMPLVNV